MSRVFGAIRQNGYVVRNLDAEVNHWAEDLGIGPWFTFSDVPLENFRYFGQPGNPHIAVALANSGDLQIELIQPLDDEPSLYQDFLAAGREGLQHFAYWTTEYQALYDTALSMGYVVGHEGQIGGEKGRFAYLDTEQGHPVHRHRDLRHLRAEEGRLRLH